MRCVHVNEADFRVRYYQEVTCMEDSESCILFDTSINTLKYFILPCPYTVELPVHLHFSSSAIIGFLSTMLVRVL